MQLIVCDPCENRIVLAVAPMMTISAVKRMISRKLGIECEFQFLSFQGVPLEDNRTLMDYRINDGMELMLDFDELYGTADPIGDIMDSPEVQEILKRQWGSFTEDEVYDFVYDNVVLSRNPGLIAEVGRLTDIVLDRYDMTVGGIEAVAENFVEFEDSGLEAVMLGTGKSANSRDVTVIPASAEEPSCQPLPCLIFDEEQDNADFTVWMKFGAKQDSDTLCLSKKRNSLL
jgi:hypothetical protein